MERARHQTGPADRAVSLVCEQKALAKGNRADVEEQLQARSRTPDQQRHHLCYGRICTRTAGGVRVPLLAGGFRSHKTPNSYGWGRKFAIRHLIVTLVCTSISLVDTGVDAVCAIRDIGAANAGFGVIAAPR